MIVAISSNGPRLSDSMSPIFGRCPCFLLVDTETLAVRMVENQAISASGGAGVQSSQMLIREGVQAAIGGNVGPNAMAVFSAAGVPVYHAPGGTVQEALEAFVAGNLQRLGAATVASDYGKGNAPVSRSGRGLGGGRGLGSGSGDAGT